MLKRKIQAGLCLAAGLLVNLTGCGEPTPPPPPQAEAAKVPPAAKPANSTPAPAAAASEPPPKADPRVSTETQVLATVKLMIARLEAKDYQWMYNYALPPADAKQYHAEKPLEEFIREFSGKGQDKALLEALKTIRDADIETDGKDPNTVVIAWKDSWANHHDMIFVKVDGRWYLGR